MADLTLREHVRQFAALDHQTTNFRSIWQDVKEFIIQWRDPTTSTRPAGTRQMGRTVDGTASHALTLSSAAVHGLTMPMGTTWFSLRHPDES